MAPFNMESCIKVEILEWILQDWTTRCGIGSIHLLISKHDQLKKFLDDNCYEVVPATPNPSNSETSKIHLQHEEPLPGGANGKKISENEDSNNEKLLGKLDQSQECEQMKKLPVELWHLIVANLSKKDLRNLRSTTKWLEEKTSSIFFMSNVIPFSKNFYSTEGDRQCETSRSTNPDEFIAIADEEISTYIKHGYKFRKLAFSLDFDEKSLGLPLALIFTQNLSSHSTYFAPITHWLNSSSFKFTYLSKLDRLARDTAKMKAAIRELDYINEFGLGLRSGFGWLHGADISDRAKLFELPPPILSEGLSCVRPTRYQRSFADLLATSTPVELLATPDLDENTRSLEDICPSLALKMFKQYARILCRITAPLDHLAIVTRFMRDHPLASAAPGSPNFGEASHYLGKNSLIEPISALSRLRQIEFGNWASLHERVVETEAEDAAEESIDRDEFWSYVNSVKEEDFVLTQRVRISAYRSAVLQKRLPTHIRGHPCIFNGCDLRLGNGALSKCVYETYVPSDLTEYQKSLIMEHADVQQSFLTSLMLSIVDCSEKFANVSKLNLVGISSRYLRDLNRCDFWDALPSLRETRLIVYPEWRNFVVEFSGSVSELSMFPSTASYMMRELIIDQISKKILKKLQLGFSDGGEHATGMFARNKFVMPAPICTENKDVFESISLGLELDEFSLVNCWATANAIVNFVRNPANKISSLKLESFSLLIFGGQYGRSSYTRELHSQLGIARANNWRQLGHGVPCMTEAEIVQFDRNFWPLLDDMSVVPQNVREALSYKTVLQDSWVEVIDKIGPGLNMEDIIKLLDKEELSARETELSSLVLDSCGYVVLKQQTSYDDFQANPEYDPFVTYNPAHFRTRASVLAQSTMSTTDIFCGRIVETWVHPEKYLLRNIYDLHTHWEGDKAETAPNNLEDGRPRGGTARYTGIIEPFRGNSHHFLSDQS